MANIGDIVDPASMGRNVFADIDVGPPPSEENIFASIDIGLPPIEGENIFAGIDIGPAPGEEKGRGFWRALIERPTERLIPHSPAGGAGMVDIITRSLRINRNDPEEYRQAAALNAQARAQSSFPRIRPSLEDQGAALQAEDVKAIETYMEEVDRKYTGLGRVGQIVGEMPKFIIEFLSTGGLKRLASIKAKRIGRKLLKARAKNLIRSGVIGTTAFMSGAALRSAGMPHRAAEAILKRQLPKGITYGPEGEVSIQASGENPWTSVVKGLGDHYIEILSEQSGEVAAPLLGKALAKTPFLGKVLTKARAKWLSLPKNKLKTAAEFSRQIGTKSGFNGVATEIGEEFWGDGLRAVFDIDDFGAGKDAGPLERLDKAIERDIENLPVMAAAFAIPGVTRFGASKILAGRERPGEEPEIPETTVPPTPEEQAAEARQIRGALRQEAKPLIAAAEAEQDRLEAAADQTDAELIAHLDSIEQEITEGQIAPEGRTAAEPTPRPPVTEIIEQEPTAAAAEGEIVYHGTVDDFTDPVRAGSFWTTSKEAAETVYGRGVAEEFKDKGRVIEGVLRKDASVADLSEEWRADIVEEFLEENDKFEENYQHITELFESRLFQNFMREKGYDAFTFSEESAQFGDQDAIEHESIVTLKDGIIIQKIAPAQPAPAAEGEVAKKPDTRTFHAKTSDAEQFTKLYTVLQLASDEGGGFIVTRQSRTGRALSVPDADRAKVFATSAEANKAAIERIKTENPDTPPEVIELLKTMALVNRKAETQGAVVDAFKTPFLQKRFKDFGATPQQLAARIRKEGAEGRDLAETGLNMHRAISDFYEQNPDAFAPTQFFVPAPAQPAPAARGIPESAKSETQKLIEAEAAEPLATTTERTEEELTGLSKARRTRIKRETATAILEHDIYQAALEAQDVRESEVDVGLYFVDKSGKEEIEQVIQSVPKGRFRNRLRKMFTFDKSDDAISWDVAVQQGLGRGKEGVAETEGHLDLTEFAERVKEALMGKKTEPGSRRLNSQAMDTAAEAGEPFIEMMVNKYRMLQHGATRGEINRMILDVADHYNIAPEAVIVDMIDGDQVTRLESLTDAEADAEIERLAEQEVEAEDLSDAEGAAKDILEKNGIDVHIETVEEITPETIQENLPEKPDDDVPFEMRGKPTGATLTQSDRQVILLAYGADSQTGYHEGYHVLRPRLTAQDGRILAREFENEEAEAAAFGRFAQDQATQTGMVRSIFQKLMRILRRIRSALQGAGFRTHEQIFLDIAAGRAQTATAKAEQKVQFESSRERLERETNKRARINAKKARMKAERKKKVSRAPLRIKLKDTTPFLRPDLKPLELPPAKMVTPLPAERKGAAARHSEEGKILFRKRERKSLREIISEKAKAARLEFDRIFESMSARLERIHPLLMSRVRRYIFDIDTRTTLLLEETAPFIKGIKKIKGDDARDLKYALNNNWRAETERLVAKYGLIEEYQALRSVLDAIHKAGNEVGLEILYRGDHFPRRVKDLKGLLKFLDSSDKHSAFAEAIRKRTEQARGRQLTDQEKTDVINTLLRGFRVGGVSLSRPGVVKDRSIEEFDRSIEKYYFELDESLEMYVQDMVRSITTREFFGKQTAEIAKLRARESRLRTRLHKLQTRTGLTRPVTLERHKTHISTAAETLKQIHQELEEHKAQPMEDTIGFFTAQLGLDSDQQDQVGKMLKAIMEPKGLHGGYRTGVKLAYLDVLANIPVAMTQLEEIGLSVYRDNLRAIPAAHKALLKKSGLKLKDIGIDDINQYMRDLGLEGWMDKAIFAMRAVDKFGKQTLLNTELARATRLARNSPNNAKFISEMRRVFGDEFRDVINDLAAGRITDNVKFLMFSKILDLQPSAITETPEYYAIGGNWRILYMLRQFTLKRMSVLRDKAVKAMTGTPADRLAALADLAKMLAILTAFGVGKDFIKDWYLGKDFDLWDSVLDNMLQFAFLSRWRVQSLERKDPSQIIGEELGPPAKAIDAIWRDVRKGEINKSVRSIPIVGEEYYWWFGGGSEKGERNEFLEMYDPFN